MGEPMTLGDTVTFTWKPRQVATGQKPRGPSHSPCPDCSAYSFDVEQGPWPFPGAKLLL